jgi:hypothetical protein
MIKYKFESLVQVDKEVQLNIPSYGFILYF